MTSEHNTPELQSKLALDLEASRLALFSVAPMLYKARGIYLKELGHQVPWITVPRDIKADLITLAEQAVRSVMHQHRTDAERQAQLVYRAAVHGALRGVLDMAKAYDPSQEHIIRRVLGSSEQALISYTRDDVAGAVIKAYLQGLVLPGLTSPERDAI